MLGLLTHETDFTVHNITVPQFHEIGDVDPVTQVEEQPIIPVFGRRFAPVLIAGDPPDLLQRQSQLAPLALLYFIPAPPERVLRFLDDTQTSGIVHYRPQVAQVYRYGCLHLPLFGQKIRISFQPRYGNGVKLYALPGKPLQPFQHIVINEHTANAPGLFQLGDFGPEHRVYRIGRCPLQSIVEGIQRKPAVTR